MVKYCSKISDLGCCCCSLAMKWASCRGTGRTSQRIRKYRENDACGTWIRTHVLNERKCDESDMSQPKTCWKKIQTTSKCCMLLLLKEIIKNIVIEIVHAWARSIGEIGRLLARDKRRPSLVNTALTPKDADTQNNLLQCWIFFLRFLPQFQIWMYGNVE